MTVTIESPPTQDTVESCAVKGIHRNRIRAVRQAMPEPVRLYELADLFKLFGDGTRIGILWALSESEMCVCDLCALLGMKQPAVSHQLKNLKQARMIKARRDGKVIYYSLDDDHIHKLLDLGMEHILEA